LCFSTFHRIVLRLLSLTLLLTLTACVGKSVVVPVPTSLPSATEAPIVKAAVTVTPPRTYPSLTKSIGIQVIDHLDDQHGLKALADFPQMGWLSVNLYWSDVEKKHTSPPTYDWTLPDETLGRAASVGYKVIVTLYGNPGWAQKTRCIPNAAGQDALPQFVQAMVARYAQSPYRVRDWAFYNEPDFGGDKNPCWGNDPAGYAALYKTLYPLVKQVDPDATIYLGGLAYETFPGAPFDPTFLDDFMAAGGGNTFDVMNFHFYSAFHYVWDRFGHGVAGKANYLRSELKRYGFTKPIACTEIGHPTAGPAADKQDYSEDATSRYVAKGVIRALADDVKPVIWFSLTDPEEDARRFGLLDQNLKRKKPFYAFQTLLRQLDGTHGATSLSLSKKSGLEGYQFLTNDGRLLWVAWSVDGKTHTLRLKAKKISLFDELGKPLGVTSAPKQAVGTMKATVTSNPVYIWIER